MAETIAQWGALAECHGEKEELLTLKQFLLVAGEGTGEEMRAISDELEEVNERLVTLMSEREKLVAEEAQLSKEWKRKKAKLSCFLKTKEGKKHTKPVKALFEACLRKFGIDYATYHGGDLVGNDCRILMGRAEEIFEKVEGVLLVVASEKRKKAATKDAISSRCRAIRDVLVVFDSVFAIVNKPNGEVEMEKDLSQLKVLLEKGLLAWCNLKDKNERGDKNITPKVHGLLHHVADQFQLYGGLGDYDEQFVEQNYQVGKKDKLRGRNRRDAKARFTSFSFWEEMRKNRKVIAQTVVVHESRKRNFKGERKPTAIEEASKSRGIDRDRIIGSIVTRDLSRESARILAMMELDNYNPVEEEIDYEHVDDGEAGGGIMMEDTDDDDGSVDGSIVGARNI